MLSPAEILGLTYVGFWEQEDIHGLVILAQTKCPPQWWATCTIGPGAPSPDAILVGGALNPHNNQPFHIWVQHESNLDQSN